MYAAAAAPDGSATAGTQSIGCPSSSSVYKTSLDMGHTAAEFDITCDNAAAVRVVGNKHAEVMAANRQGSCLTRRLEQLQQHT